MIRDNTLMIAIVSMTVIGTVAGCSEFGSSDQATMTLPKLSDEFTMAWENYAACPGGCPISDEDAMLLEDVYYAYLASPYLTDDSRAVITALGDEAAALGIHPTEMIDRIQELPSYTDSRLYDLFLSTQMCDFFDELNGDPIGTMAATGVCDTEWVGYWVEPISKGIAIGVGVAAIVGGTTCSVKMLTCKSAADTNHAVAPTRCGADEYFDEACGHGVHASQLSNCIPCGGSPAITDYDACCKKKTCTEQNVDGKAVVICEQPVHTNQ